MNFLPILHTLYWCTHWVLSCSGKLTIFKIKWYASFKGFTSHRQQELLVWMITEAHRLRVIVWGFLFCCFLFYFFLMIFMWVIFYFPLPVSFSPSFCSVHLYTFVGFGLFMGWNVYRKTAYLKKNNKKDQPAEKMLWIIAESHKLYTSNSNSITIQGGISCLCR